MASCLQIFRDKRGKNGGYSNDNCQDPEDDPQVLMDEFCCLYSEKLKAIEEEYPESLEPKCQALSELVSDLTEQNCMLLRTVEELEKEALSRVEAFSNLAEAAKDTIQQDTVRRGIEANKSFELESKVLELQEALKQNELHLSCCMVEVDRLTKCLCEQNSECDELKLAQERMCELEKTIQGLETNFKEKCDIIKSVQMENEKFKDETSCADVSVDIRLQEVNCQLQLLKEELKQKNCLLDKYKSQAYTPSELQCLESSHLNNILMLKDGLIDQLVEGDKETRLDLVNDSRIYELTNNVQWLECQLKEKDTLLNQTVEERDALQVENEQASICNASLHNRIDDLTKEIDCLKCVICDTELEAGNQSSTECYAQNEVEDPKLLQQRLKQYEEQIVILENTLLQNSAGNESNRIELLNQIESLQQEVSKRNCEIISHKDQEENLKYEISRMKTYINGLERQWKEKTLCWGSEIEKKNALLLKYQKQLDNMNLFAANGQRLVSKTKSDSAVTVSKQACLHSQHSMESFEEYKNYIQVINELENDFEETRKALCFLWKGFQSYAQESGDSMLNELHDILTSFENSKKYINEVMAQLENMEELKGNNSIFCYNLKCIKGNLLDISESLSKAQMLSSSSEASFLLEAGDAGGIKKKLSVAINDSLSIIKYLENLKSVKNVSSQTNDLSNIIDLIKPIVEEKYKCSEKVASIQKQQLEFSETLINKILEFEKGFSSYHGSADCLKKETRKLFAIILAKEKQIQKQFDEIDNLKTALSSNKYVEEASEEIDSLRKVVSNKDMQLVEKQELIQNLRSLNHSLRRRQLSLSSPSLICTTESSENAINKSHLLEEGLLDIKEKFSAISSDIRKSKDKMVKFEVETKCLVQALTVVHQEITAAKELVSQNPEKLSVLGTSFNEAEIKVVELLHALEIFICDEQPDFKVFTESINNHIETLLDIIEVIKGSFKHERLLMKSLEHENREIKEQLIKLQNRLTVAITPQTELNETPQYVGNEYEAEVGVYTKDEFIQSLKEDLCRSNSYLGKMQEEYKDLKMEKEEMEERNQKVMEELQAKICKLQAALQNQAPEADCLYQLCCIVEEQSQKIHQYKLGGEALMIEISSKNKEIEINNSEIKSLKNKLKAINCMYTELQMKFEEAKVFIVELQENQKDKKLETKSLKNELNILESMYAELQEKFEEAKAILIEYQEKLSEKQVNEVQSLREISNFDMNLQTQELTDLKGRILYWQNITLQFEKEISDKADEVGHWQKVSTRLKENLTCLIEENQTLKFEIGKFVSERAKLVDELKTSEKDLCEMTGALVKSKQFIYLLNLEKDENENERIKLINELDSNNIEFSKLKGELDNCKQLIYQLNQEKADLENTNISLQSDLQEKERSIVENNSSREAVDQNILQEREEFIEILLLKIAQMNNFLSDKDESINILESQLKTSTMLMLDHFDYNEDQNQQSLLLNKDHHDTNILKMTTVTRTAAYKMKLWQSLEINRRKWIIIGNVFPWLWAYS